MTSLDRIEMARQKELAGLPPDAPGCVCPHAVPPCIPANGDLCDCPCHVPADCTCGTSESRPCSVGHNAKDPCPLGQNCHHCNPEPARPVYATLTRGESYRVAFEYDDEYDDYRATCPHCSALIVSEDEVPAPDYSDEDAAFGCSNCGNSLNPVTIG